MDNKITMTGHENEHIKAMEKKLEELDKKVTTISEALLGNEFSTSGGFVHVLKDHEERLDKIEDANVLTHDVRIKALEDNAIQHKTYVYILKFIASVITAGVITYMFSVIFKA